MMLTSASASSLTSSARLLVHHWRRYEVDAALPSRREEISSGSGVLIISTGDQDHELLSEPQVACGDHYATARIADDVWKSGDAAILRGAFWAMRACFGPSAIVARSVGRNEAAARVLTIIVVMRPEGSQ